MKINKIILACVLALTAIIPAAAQNTMSPYSRFGYGILSDNVTSAQAGMGGVGYAMNSGRQINVMNPASYAHVDSLTFLFDIGLNAQLLWSKDGDASGHSFGGGVDYITMLFPLSKRLGMSIGLLPYSSVGYTFGGDIENGSTQRTGSGGLNQLYAGLGYMPFKGFSVGANISYLFGSIHNELMATSDKGTQTVFQRIMEVRDFHLNFGVQYSLNVTPKHRLTAGLTYSPKKTLLGHYWGEKGEYNEAAGTVAADTTERFSLNGANYLSETWGAGLCYQWENRLMAEVDFTYQPWSKAKFTNLDGFGETRLDNRWKVAAGVQYTPEPRGSYFKRCQYRIGGFYSRDYVMVGDNHILDRGVSVGVGFPAPVGKTMINLGLEYRNRQASPAALVKENYFNITIGVNFNEMWFFRNKIR